MIIDSFAGGGGASLGIELALGRSPDIAINHDAIALAMHEMNHPNCIHLTENVWQVDLSEYVKDEPVELLWASPDCRHFSKARGSKPTSKSVRMLAWSVVKFVRDLKHKKPKVICLENVEEFKTWEDFDKWKRELKRYGYKIEMKNLRACDYGAPTIRNRLFIIMRSDGRPIVWPEPTHGKPGSDDVVSGKLLPWMPAHSCIDFSIPCPSIFDSSEEIKEKYGLRAIRPLSDNTLKRVAKGVMKYTLQAENPFLISVNHGDSGGRREYSTAEPLNTVTKSNGMALIAPSITAAQHGGSNRSANEPIHTIAASRKDQNSIIVPALATMGYGEKPGQNPRTQDPNDPLNTITAGGVKAAVVAAFLAQHNTERSGHNPGRSAKSPLATVTTRGTQTQLVSSSLLSLKGTDRRGIDLNSPHPTVLAGGGHSAEIRAFLLKYYGTAVGQDINDPAHSVTTKERFGLVTININGEPYYIADIGMRMLTPRELFRAQGFHDKYIIDKKPDGSSITKTQQVHKCGNSVSPKVVEAIISANCGYLKIRKEAA